MKKILPIVLLSSTAFAGEHIELDKNMNGQLAITSSGTAFVSGNKNNTMLAHVDFNTNQVTSLQLPLDPIVYSHGMLANFDNPQAFVLTGQGIFHSTESGVKELVSVSSFYTAEVFDVLKYQKFTLDANNDGLTDFYFPGIERQTLFIQDDKGQFSQLSLPMTGKTTTHFSDNRLTVSHQLPATPDMIDITGDGHKDLVFIGSQAISYFPVSEHVISQQLKHISFLDQVNKHTKQQFVKLSDVNNDGYPDIHTKEGDDKGEDGEINFDSESIHRVYFAKKTSEGLKHNEKSDIKVTLEGASSIASVSDFDGDGIQDLAIYTVDIGFTDIISIASAAMNNKEIELDIEVAIFKGQGNNLFAKKESTSKDFEIAIDMNDTSGSNNKGIFFSDFNNDGSTDLLVKTDNDELSLYSGDKKRMLSRKAKRIKRDLPKSNNDIYFKDINQDGVKDVVLKIKDNQESYRLEVLYMNQ